jgi:signal peptidase
MKKILFLLLFFALMISLKTFREEYRLLMVLSGSMEPALKKGDIVIVRKSSSYSREDIIAFRENFGSKILTHRIKEIKRLDNKYFFTTKGDNNKVEDPYPTSEKEILGKVIFRITILSIIYENPTLIDAVFIISTCLAGFFIGKITGKTIDCN